jgi:hypothetical protein
MVNDVDDRDKDKTSGKGKEDTFGIFNTGVPDNASIAFEKQERDKFYRANNTKRNIETVPNFFRKTF